MTPPSSDTPGVFGTPRLDVRWQARRANFLESCRAALSGPRASRDFDSAASFFHLRISPRRAPGRGIAGSLIWHVILLSISIPLGQMAEPAPKLTLPQIQITWYGPTTNVAPAPAPKPSEAKPAVRPKARPKQVVIARAYNPKTTVVFQPPRPTSSRQVLIEPDAPPTPPKFLPGMPNIITWTAAQPVQPTIAVNPDALMARKPKRGSVAEAMAPNVAHAALPTGPLNILPPRIPTLEPPLPLAASSIRAKRSQAQTKSAAAPTVAFAASRLVALSLAPGKALPPPGNASAPISIGPHVGKIVSSAAPDVAFDAQPGATGTPTAKGATPGPAGLLILNAGAVPAPPPAPPATRPLPRIAAPSPLALRPPALRADRKPESRVMPHDLAHQVLGMRPIQTLLMSMPNLTSATGSWVLDFAELPGEKIPLNGTIVPPLPVRKVDPEYPPEIIQEQIQGEVVLYAVIDRDGTVSRIRVVKSLDPTLDHNAEVAFSKWKFQPALADNEPIDLQVLVHIPFRYQVPR